MPAKDLMEDTSLEDQAVTPVGENAGADGGEKDEVSSEEEDVKVPESFQRAAQALVASCTNNHCLDFLSNLVSEARQEGYEKDTPTATTGAEFSDSDMPKD